MKLNSIRFKSIILYTSFLFLILILFSGVIYFTVRHILYKKLDENLKIKAVEMVSVINSYHEYPFRTTVMDRLWRLKVESLNLKNDYINILNTHGKTIVRSENFKDDIKILFKRVLPFTFSRVYYSSIRSSKYKLRVINLPIQNTFLEPYVVQVGTSLKRVNTTLKELLSFIIISVFCILILTSSLGLVLTKSILKPVMQVAKTANSISHKNLNQRIEVKQLDEEMKYLINSFNSMIERLEKSFHHINEFSGHVAHELKTPLAIIKGEMEVTLNKKQRAPEYRRIINSSLEEINRLNKIIKDILLLAKLEYEQDIYKFERLDLTEYLNEISDNSRILAEEKKIKLILNAPDKHIFVYGDKLHLRRLFFNLLHNAIKYTPKKGEISIDLIKKKHNVFISITDTGQGISLEHIPKVFNKFYRIQKRSYSVDKGIGLGLSIAQTIAQSHQGSIEVKSKKNQGSTFTFILPLYKDKNSAV